MSDVNLYVGNYLSLSYLKEELNTNNISISSDKSYKEYETQEKRYIFDPEETGEYKISYSGNSLSSCW